MNCFLLIFSSILKWRTLHIQHHVIGFKSVDILNETLRLRLLREGFSPLSPSSGVNFLCFIAGLRDYQAAGRRGERPAPSVGSLLPCIPNHRSNPYSSSVHCASHFCGRVYRYRWHVITNDFYLHFLPLPCPVLCSIL